MLVFDKLGHKGLSTYYGSSVLKILYPDAVKHNNYSKTLTSVAFAGTFVGMLIFGWISDKIGRKFGMVRAISGSSDFQLSMVLSLPRCPLLESLLSFLPSLRRRPALTVVPPASLLCSVHAGKSADDTMTSPLSWQLIPRRGIVSSSVSVLAQNILVDPSQPLSSPRKMGLQRMRNTGGLPWLRVRNHLWQSPWRYLCYYPRHHDRLWFRHLFICATGSVLDVGASLFHVLGASMLTPRSSQIWQ